MKRTISAEVGKGSVNHNNRKFKAENVDGSRTHLNIDYCNDRIQTVYHQLFDEALKRYNKKQTRSDRRIPNYYENNLIAQAKDMEQQRKQNQRTRRRNTNYER